MTQVLPSDPEGIEVAARCLRDGGVVGMPTETVYGLAAVFTDAAAVARVFAVKERPLFDPLIVHVDHPESIGEVIDPSALGPRARTHLDALVAAFWPGPLTIVAPRRDRVPDLVTSGLDTVAVRLPAHPVARALIAAAGAPLVAPSANRFGRISPTTAADVVHELGGRIPYVVDGGRCTIGVESTVVKLGSDGVVALLRPGGVPVEQVERVLGARVAPPGPAIEAPGQLVSHYAPRTPCLLAPGPIAGLEDNWLGPLPPRVAVLVAAGSPASAVARLGGAGKEVVASASLSDRGDPEQAARVLFSTLRELDRSGADVIVAEPWPDPVGLGRAVQDRLTRASAR